MNRHDLAQLVGLALLYAGAYMHGASGWYWIPVAAVGSMILGAGAGYELRTARRGAEK